MNESQLNGPTAYAVGEIYYYFEYFIPMIVCAICATFCFVFAWCKRERVGQFFFLNSVVIAGSLVGI